MKKDLEQANSLSEVFESIDDPRNSRGVRYSLSFLLNCAQAAVLSGAQGFRQIGEWIAAQPASRLREIGNTRSARPDESTLRKCFKKIKLGLIRTDCYAFFTSTRGVIKDAIAVDGKTIRASRNSNDRQPHCLSAALHYSGIVVGDLLVPNKRGETDFIKPLLDKIDITKKVVTADALHSIATFGQYLVKRKADYVFITKGNRKKLIQRLELLDIKNNFSSFHEEVNEKAHGRLETRRIYTTERLPFWLCFKSARQAFIIERERKLIKQKKISVERHFGLTSLSAKKANAEEIAKHVRGHWTIENKVFHVRDTAFNEDRSRIRAGPLPELMILLRNIAMNLFRLRGSRNIAQSIRKCMHNEGFAVSLIKNT